MTLDRNTNVGGRGKYALVHMRKLIPALDLVAKIEARKCITEKWSMDDVRDAEAFERLVESGIITLGNESPGDQFFVMKYKDCFTASGLHAYAIAVKGRATALRKHNSNNPMSEELDEYAEQMFLEAKQAERVGVRIPD